MNIGKLCKDVRHCLDEQGLLSEIEMTIEDALPIDERIEALLCGAVNAIQLLLPLRYLVPTPMPIDSHEPDIQLGIGTIRLPQDFLRLGSFKMKGWKKSVHGMINDYDPEYSLQLCSATRGGLVSPVVARVDEGDCLQYFSLPKGKSPHIVEIATYIKTAIPEDITNLEMREEAYNLLVWWLAKDVATSFQRDTQNIENIIKTTLQTYGN